MNPHANQPTSLFALMRSCIQNRRLIVQMIKREVHGRYKGSVIGLGWSFFNPILMLAVYTFVFSEVFKARWGISTDENKTQFAVVLFVGMIIHGLFSEVVSRAPNLILSNTNYVKKVVFPLEILPVITIGVALFHALISLSVLLLAFLVFNGFMQWTVIFIPIILLPFILFVLGLAWLFSSLGVFARDIGQAIGLITIVLMFLSPVFYPVTALPVQFQPWLLANPLTFIIEQSRDVLIWGRLPNFMGLIVYMICSTILVWFGFAWFQKTRKGFADVI